MKAVILNGFGHRDVLQVGNVDTPEIKPRQVLIKVKATSINRADITQRQGNYPAPPGESEILGLEAAGVVESVGPDVEGWKKGDRVMSLVAGGGYAEYAAAYAEHLIPIPQSISFEEAACISEVYITAFLNIFRIGGLKDTETALIHGATGGIGTAAMQLCKILTPGARIIVTASSGKVDRAKEMGADLVIDYKKDDFTKRVKAYTEDKGVNLILDHIGAAYLSRNMDSLAIGGRLVLIGVLGGTTTEINLAHIMVNRQQIIGSVLRARPVKEKGEIVSHFIKTVLPYLADRTIGPVIFKTLPIDEVAEAHRIMEENLHFGNIVLTMDS